MQLEISNFLLHFFEIVECVGGICLINNYVAIMHNELTFFKKAWMTSLTGDVPQILTFIVHFFQVSVLDFKVKFQCILSHLNHQIGPSLKKVFNKCSNLWLGF